MNIKIPSYYYAGVIAILLMLSMYIVIQISLSKLETSQNTVLERNESAARKEFLNTIELIHLKGKEVIKDTVSLAETKQQFEQPVYYSYWRDNRSMISDVLPKYVKVIELYGEDKKSLSKSPLFGMPFDINNTENIFFYIYKDRLYLIMLETIVVDKERNISGFVGIGIDFLEAFSSIKQYKYLNDESITYTLDTKKTAPFMEYEKILSYKAKEDRTLLFFKTQMIESYYLAILIICLISYSSFIIMYFFLVAPIRKLSKYIDSLRNKKNHNTIKPYSLFPVTEIETLYSAFNLFQNELVSAMQGAEAANQAKSIFLANMSHEIRTPLNAILGFTQILKKNEQDEQRKKDVETIHRNGKHLLNLINSILDISKIEAGAMELELSNFDLNIMITSIIDIFSFQCKRKKIEWSYKSFTEQPIPVYADEKKLKQVLINLIGNAVKFTKEGHVHLNMTQIKEDYYQFKISDTGDGITTNQESDIFEQFHQGDAGHKEGGTGLGLSITKKLSELMGGKLKFKSHRGLGTDFYFTIHLTKAKEILGQPSITDNGATPIIISKLPLTAMVVDDNDENLQLLKRILEDVDIIVNTATNGKEALTLLSKEKIDIIFMDIQMPLMDGHEAINIIRKDKKLSLIKCVAVTASCIENKNEQFVSMGFDDYIPKPFETKNIYDALRLIDNVDVVYEESHKNYDKISISKPDLSGISINKNLYQQMSEAAEFGQIDKLQSYLSELKLNQDYTLLAQYLLDLLDQYKINEFIETLGNISHDS